MTASTAAFTIETVSISILCIVQIVGAILFYRRRHNFLIRHRLPFVTLYTNLIVLLLNLSVLAQEVAYYFVLPFSCAITLFALHLGTISIGEFFIIRGFYLYSIFYQQKSFGDDEKKKKYLPFLSSKFRLLLVCLSATLHLSLFALQMLYKDESYYCLSTNTNCFIGEEWIFLLIHGSFVLIIGCFLLKKLIQVEENLKIKLEFIVAQVSIFLALALMIPLVIWALLNYPKDPAKIRDTLFFGINFYYVPIVAMTHILITLIWPLYLDYKAENKKWPVSKVYDEKTMNDFLKSEENMVKLKKISRFYFCFELLLFWEDVQEYKKNLIMTEAEIKKMEIIKKYLMGDSELEINISSKTKKEIMGKINTNDNDKNIFDVANNEVLRLIMENIYNLFIIDEKKKEINKEKKEDN
eukprot:GAHX01001337.1.p1 GENE.GAHX01001337.1~~GAHX01001337.1.p1  ORF type:complete len:411 (+),score=73.55 GAHX01001337.1:580-1812(+)